ncbi:MAG: DUF4215 domain-containing protein [Nanoarchaeota archaeon]
MMPVKSAVTVKSSSRGMLSQNSSKAPVFYKSKPFIIIVIAVVAVIGLALLLLNADKLAGKAIEQPSKTLVVTQITPSCTAAPAGLLHWWRGEQNTEDSIGNVDLQRYGGATYAVGNVGNSLAFDGVDDYAYVAPSVIDFTAEGLASRMSVEAWIYNTGILPNKFDFLRAGGIQFKSGDSQNQDKVQLNVDFSDGTSVNIVSKNTLPLKEWTHLVGVFTGSAVRFYVNGVLQDSGLMYLNGKLVSFDNPVVRVGAAHVPITRIDEVSIYNTGISASVAKLYNAGTYGKCVPQVVCGNSIVESDETCDDGNSVSGDGCSSICVTELVSCGNNIKEGNEECDKIAMPLGVGCITLGFDGGSLSCKPDCTFDTSQCTEQVVAVCGNSVLEVGEQCDDGNIKDNDGCSAVCQMEQVQQNLCGDGVTVSPEQCDDGNIKDNDGCSAYCEIQNIPVCGDGVVDETEECDDGNVVNGDGCSSACQTETGGMIDVVDLPVCGDGIIDGTTEQCDDSNQVSGDGCSSACLIEDGWDTDGDGVADNLEPANCLGVAGNVYSSGTLAGCLVGDVTSDGCVGLPDIANIGPNVDLSCFSGGNFALKTAEQGDTNADGCVNLADIAQIGPNVDLQCGGQ